MTDSNLDEAMDTSEETEGENSNDKSNPDFKDDNKETQSSSNPVKTKDSTATCHQPTLVPCTSQDQSPISEENEESREKRFNSKLDDNPDSREAPEPSDFHSLCMSTGDKPTRMEDKWTSDTVVRHKETNKDLGTTEVFQEETEKQNLFKRLHLDRCQKNLRATNFLQISAHSLHFHESCAEQDLVQTFIQNLLMIDYRARCIHVKVSDEQHKIQQKDYDSSESDIFADFFENKSLYDKGISQSERIHPMDVQMAVFHCADGFLKQLMVTKLSQCQYALPLLVPDPSTRQIEFPLWTFRQINKSWKMRNTDSDIISKTQPIYKAKTAMVFFFRFGSVSSSKSQLMNSLINERHNTFFHRNCKGSSRTRVLMDGVVEIAWYCPSGTNDDKFNDCVAFCNLHGDAGDHEKQLQILTEMASVNVVLLPQMDRNERHAEKIQNLYKDRKPLICLFTEDESAVTEKLKADKFKIGLKNRNQSDVSEELREAINACLSPSSSTIILKDVFRHTDIRVDEESDDDCQRGREAAQNMMKLLKNTNLTEIKESLLPRQGKLWHQWSQKNKELHRPRGDEIEMEISLKKTEMKEIRQKQYKSDISEFMRLFIKEMMSNAECEKLFFLKWLRILLDEHTSADLSKLHHKYDTTWSNVLQLKESQELVTEQTELERISKDLQAATFGLEHIMREVSQIYESSSSVNEKKNKKDLQVHFSSLPSLAAEMMISGFPLELMDGDAAHVPVTWISAVLDQLIQKLGDQKVFVLSVLGLQSSGKSTMLNAMFGLEFAVSAGRCTKGAFMQLLKVSDEMKTQLKCNYFVVVDTEGLRASELAGRSTRHHDNELATFVVGLGHLTLINIFGENPSEMQDILQIVVQAILRMKKVRLNPSCVFVHQNVSDITAGDKNMEGRRRLQEKLDEMTKLAAKEEDSDAERFSHVIKFDVQNDVKYFAQLWEGNPPMAPPNPKYCKDIQELKNTVFSKATCITLSQFKGCLSGLWEALLNENFVFSFRNILEIAVYRRLETKYNNWTWKLRSAMLKIEEKFQNRIDNGEDEVKINDLLADMNETKEAIQKSFVSYFEEDTDKEILSQWRGRFEIKITELHDGLIKRAKRTLDEVIEQKKAREKLDGKKKEYENKLFSRSKELALQFKNITDECVLKKEFDSVWSTWITALIKHTPPVKDINFWNDVMRILSEKHELSLLQERQNEEYYKKINLLGEYLGYIKLKKNVELDDQDQSHKSSDENCPEEQKEMSVTAKSRFSHFFQFNILYFFRQRKVGKKQDKPQSENNTLGQYSALLPEDHASVRDLISHIIDQTSEILIKTQTAKVGYHDGYIQEMTECVQNNISEYQNKNKKFKLKKEFTVDLCLHVCDSAHDKFTVLHNEFRNAKDPRIYLENQKPQYYSVFKNYCRGATTTAIFAEFICSKLESSILQAVYNQSAIGLSDLMMSDIPALNGNRSKLEKHILKSLAEEENFEEYMKYIHNPREHFKGFITREVDRFSNQHHQKVLTIFNRNLTRKAKAVSEAVHKSIVEVKGNKGDAFTWQKLFTHTLSEELKFTGNSCADLSEVTDFDFLEKMLIENLTGIISNLQDGLNKIEAIKMEECRKKPDELLIDHLCQCCWVQCPFCGAICTNTIENHNGDHSVAFHRNIGLNGWFYRGTTNLSTGICTSAVASDRSFYPDSSENTVPWKAYRKGGAKYSNWSITPDLSELPYWKWFVCTFQKDLEKYYKKTFEGTGMIPDEWREHSKDKAIQSLDEYI